MSDKPSNPSEPIRVAYWGNDLVLEADFPGTAILPPVKFKYHPPNFTEFGQIQKKLNNQSDAEQSGQIILEIVAANLKSWDIPVAVDSLNELGRVAPAIIDYIFRMITASAKSPGIPYLIERAVGK